MSGSQQIVGAGGAALVVLEFATGPGRQTIETGLFADNPTAKQQAAARTELAKLGASVLFVAVATICAGLSTAWARAMVSVIVGLFLLWAINRYTEPATGASSSAATSTNPASSAPTTSPPVHRRRKRK